MNNLIPTAVPLQNIKNFTPALRISDDIVVAGIGGNFLPAITLMHPDQCVYQCTQVVDEEAKTWIAKAYSTKNDRNSVYQTGIQLTSSKLTPVVGHYYNRQCTVQFINMSSDQPVFYASCTKQNPQLGVFEKRQNASIGTIDGKTCTKFSYNSDNRLQISSKYTKDSPYNLVWNFWLNISSQMSDVTTPIITLLSSSYQMDSHEYGYFCVYRNGDTIQLVYRDQDTGNTTKVGQLPISDYALTGWHMYTLQWTRQKPQVQAYRPDGYFYLYIDKTAKSAGVALPWNCGIQRWNTHFSWQQPGMYSFSGGIRDIRIYNLPLDKVPLDKLYIEGGQA